LALKHESPTRQLQMETITGRQAEGGSDLGGYDKSTLLTEDERGIHDHIVPRAVKS